MGRLTATAVKANLLKPGTYQDGDGLFLKVRADRTGGAGSAQWLMRIQRDGKRQDVGLGSAKTVTLAQARAKADELRNAVKVGKRDVLAEKKDEAAAKITFRVAARQYHAETRLAGKAPSMAASGLPVWKTTPSQNWATCRPAQSPLPTLSRC